MEPAINLSPAAIRTLIDGLDLLLAAYEPEAEQRMRDRYLPGSGERSELISLIDQLSLLLAAEDEEEESSDD